MAIAAADDFGGMFVFGAVAITFALFSGTFAIRLFDFFLLLGIVIVTFGPFFFSSRRRQTRSLRDWSSDVCSSDLGTRPQAFTPRTPSSASAATGGAYWDRPRIGAMGRAPRCSHFFPSALSARCETGIISHRHE